MSIPVPDQWIYDPPQLLVVGDNAYAASLAQVLTVARLGTGDLLAGPARNETGQFPRVLEELEGVIFVIGPSQFVVDVLACHEALWNWVERLTSAGAEHELAIIFLLPCAMSPGIEQSLELGLALPRLDGEGGHSVARMGDSLESLVDLLVRTRAQDFVAFRTRRNADRRHAVINALKGAIEARDPSKIIVAAQDVLHTFEGCEYQLDYFCRPPSHPNGHRLRSWLSTIVTPDVTPSSVEAMRSELSDLLS